MQIVCPNCTTSYAVDPAKFGPAGRSVRCARCRQTWVARPEPIPVTALAGHTDDHGSQEPGWGDNPAVSQDNDLPHIDSPALAIDADSHPASESSNSGRRGFGTKTPAVRHWLAGMRESRLRKLLRHIPVSGAVAPFGKIGARINAKAACAVMAAAVAGLLFWRADIVRALPQTATFFRISGLSVNLRGLEFQDLRVTTEVVGDKPVLVIQGSVVAASRKPVEIPRLRFVVRDAHGTEIYAWNAVLEQSVLNPGERAGFTSRLAAPPAEGREIAVRAFQRRDIAAGGA